MTELLTPATPADEKAAELPIKMDRFFHRSDYRNGELTICITDAAHFVDAWNFARKVGKAAEFERAFMRLLCVSLGGTIPQPEWTRPDGTICPAYAGQNRKLSVYPDSHSEPSFGWQEEPGMVGGLIWHRHSGDWGIHT